MDEKMANDIARTSTFSGNILDRYRIGSVLRSIRRVARRGYASITFDTWLWFSIGDPEIVERHLKTLGYSTWWRGAGLMTVSWEKYGAN